MGNKLIIRHSHQDKNYTLHDFYESIDVNANSTGRSIKLLCVNMVNLIPKSVNTNAQKSETGIYAL